MYQQLLEKNNLIPLQIFQYKGDTYLVTYGGIYVKNADNWEKDDKFLLALFMGEISLVRHYFVPDITSKELYKEYNSSASYEFHKKNNLVCKTKEEAVSLAKKILRGNSMSSINEVGIDEYTYV